MQIRYGKITIPHIGYTIHVKKFKENDRINNGLAYVERTNQHSSTLYIPQCRNADLAHELVHVLQNICIDRNIDFITETEHMGYLMHYIYARVIGTDYNI